MSLKKTLSCHATCFEEVVQVTASGFKFLYIQRFSDNQKSFVITSHFRNVTEKISSVKKILTVGGNL